jgi:hypothetical protein
MDFANLISPHELTPFLSPSLLHKEGECTGIQNVTAPLCGAERGMLNNAKQGVSSWEKLLFLGSYYTILKY